MKTTRSLFSKITAYSAVTLVSLAVGCGSKTTSNASTPAVSLAADVPELQIGDLNQAQLEIQLKSMFENPKYSDAHWGVRVEDLDGNIIFDMNGQKSFMPASQHKVFTTSCALDMLGHDFVYETDVVYTGEIINGTLNGDVIIVGSGDPSLGAWHGEGVMESKELLPLWVNALRGVGIENINGRIIGDGRVFTEEFINTSWNYGDLPYWYACGTSGLAMEENCFRCKIFPGENVGDLATVTWEPDTSYIDVIIETETVAAGERSTADSFNYQTEGNTIYFGGVIPKDREVVNERAAIWDGPRYAAYLFMEELEKQGFEVSGGAVNILDVNYEQLDQSDKELLLTHTSPPLSELCNVVNKISHNFFADQIVRTLGYKFGDEGSFSEGTSVVRNWLEENEIPEADKFRMRDGSGLSYRNRFQPRQATALYRMFAPDEKFFEWSNENPSSDYSKALDRNTAFFLSLPESGVDGSLRNRINDEDSTGRVHAKTGYIGGARTLGGFAETYAGETLVFSMMCNNYAVATREVNETQNQACELLLKYVE